MGIGGSHPDFILLDEIADLASAGLKSAGRGYGKGTLRVAVGFGTGGSGDITCPACVGERHEKCWQHDPPLGVPFLICPCRRVWPTADHLRYVVTSGRCPLGEAFATERGYLIFDRDEHRPVGGWFAMEMAAIAVARDMRGPTAADIARARVELAAMLESL